MNTMTRTGRRRFRSYGIWSNRLSFPTLTCSGYRSFKKQLLAGVAFWGGLKVVVHTENAVALTESTQCTAKSGPFVVHGIWTFCDRFC
jgi:hypothetical protein